MCKIFRKYILLSKYLKCSVWKLAVRYDIYIYVVRRQRVKQTHPHTQVYTIPKRGVAGGGGRVVQWPRSTASKGQQIGQKKSILNKTIGFQYRTKFKLLRLI